MYKGCRQLKQKTKVINLKPRRSITLEDYYRVIALRFGSMTDFDRIRLTPKEVSKQSGINYVTVCKLLQRFVDNNYQIHMSRHLNGKAQHLCKITTELSDWLLSPETTQLMNRLPLP